LQLRVILNTIGSGGTAMYVCVCQGIRERELRAAIHAGAESFEELQARTGVATCCRSCEPMARALLGEALASRPRATQAA
jgi:bacterioferritin-associated ferredoxin